MYNTLDEAAARQQAAAQTRAQPVQTVMPMPMAPKPIPGMGGLFSQFTPQMNPSAGGLFGRFAPGGGLMDFNQLSSGMSDPRVQMPYSPQIMSIFNRALPMIAPRQTPDSPDFKDSIWHKLGMAGIYGMTVPHKIKDLF